MNFALPIEHKAFFSQVSNGVAGMCRPVIRYRAVWSCESFLFDSPAHPVRSKSATELSF